MSVEWATVYHAYFLRENKTTERLQFGSANQFRQLNPICLQIGILNKFKIFYGEFDPGSG